LRHNIPATEQLPNFFSFGLKPIESYHGKAIASLQVILLLGSLHINFLMNSLAETDEIKDEQLSPYKLDVSVLEKKEG